MKVCVVKKPYRGHEEGDTVHLGGVALERGLDGGFVEVVADDKPKTKSKAKPKAKSKAKSKAKEGDNGDA